ncbi:hypothetical protein ACVXHA_03895 [Escherichia coli]
MGTWGSRWCLLLPLLFVVRCLDSIMAFYRPWTLAAWILTLGIVSVPHGL